MSLKIYFLTLFIVLFTSGSATLLAQCPPATNPSFTSNTTTANCASDGSMTINATGGLGPYLYEIVSGPTTRPVQSSNTFNGIPSGSYTVEVTDNCGLTVTGTVTVPGTYVNPTLSITATPLTCPNGNDGALNISVSGGSAPFTYALVNPSPIQIGPQATGSFSNLTEGSYTIQVTDNCGNIVSQNYFLDAANVGVPYLNSYSSSKTGCNVVSVTTYASTIPAGSNPANPYMYSVTAGQVTYPPQSSNTFSLPQGGSYTFVVEDACGNESNLSIDTDPVLQIQDNQTCSGWEVTLVAQWMLEPIEYEIVSGPITQGPQSSSTFTNLVDGTYIFQATDDCGMIEQQTIDLTSEEFDVSYVDNNPNCDPPNVDLRFIVSGYTNPVTVSYISGPSSFAPSVKYTAGLIGIQDLAPGTYSIRFVDACGKADTQIVVANNSYSYNFNYSIEKLCNISNLELGLGHNASSYLGSLYSIIDGPITFPEQTSGQFNNLTPGTYIVQAYPYYCKNRTPNNSFVYDTIEIEPYVPPELLLSGTLCNSGNQGDIFCLVENGIPNYTYEILSGPTSGGPQSNSLFENVTEGTYQIRTIDNCGNSDILGIELTEYGEDNIHYNPLCSGDTLNMYADTLPFASYTWTGPSGFNSDDRFVSIEPFTQSNVGTYSLHIAYNTCIDTTFQFDINLTGGGDPSFVTSNICAVTGNEITFQGDTGGVFNFNQPPGDGASINSSTGEISNYTIGNTYIIQYQLGIGSCISLDIDTVHTSNIQATSVLDDVSCYGQSNGSIDVTPSGGNGSYSYNWSNGETSSLISGLSGGSFTVTITDANNCSKTENYTIDVPDSLEISNSKSNVSCFGGSDGSISLSTTGGTTSYTYDWSNGDTIALISGLTNGSYSVTVTDGNGCEKTGSFTIDEPTDLTLSNSMDSVDCNGANNGEIILEVSGGSPGYSYNWTNGDVDSIANQLPAGSYEVTVTDNNGCSKIQQYTVEEPSALSVSSNINHISCNGGSNAFISLNVSGGNPGYNYVWNNGLMTDSIGDLSFGIYSVTISDAHNCLRIDTFQINQPTVLNAIGSSQQPLCYGDSNGIATIAAFGGAPEYSYEWGPEANNQDSSTATHLAAGLYSVLITDSNNCTYTVNVLVNEPDSLDASTSMINEEGCGMMNGQATVTSQGGTGTHHYQWNDPINQITGTASNLSGGTYEVTITDDNGCYVMDSVEVTVDYSVGGPDILINTSGTTCETSSDAMASVIPTSGTNPYTYLWDSNANNQDSITATNLGVGTYEVTITDANGCYTDTTLEINNNNAPPSANFTITPPSCYQFEDAEITANTSNGVPPYSFTWSNGDTSNTTDSLSAGTYYLNITDDVGCSFSDTLEVAQTPSLQPAISAQTYVCFGDSILLTANGSEQTIGYVWSNGDSSNETYVSPTVDSTFFVTITNGLCFEETSFDVKVKDLPEILFSGNPFICDSSSTYIMAISTAQQYLWNTGETGNTITVNANDILSSYTVTVTDSLGCRNSNDAEQIEIVVYPKPWASFATLQANWFAEDIAFIDSSSNDVIYWNWNFGDGSESTLSDPVHQYQNTGPFDIELVVENEYGCMDTTLKTIFIEEKIETPNVFSPNGDGINDYFTIPRSGNGNYLLVITNRWGQELFRADSDRIIWDGRLNSGQMAPEGTYYYVVTAFVNNQEVDLNGYITLLR